MVYGVFGGCYSDWYTVGYFNNRLDADKYCAAYGNGDYYVIELKDLQDEKDLSQISLKYEHDILFDFRDNEWVMRDESDRYKCYIAEELKPNSVWSMMTNRWVGFRINIEKDNRKLAEKIAQDYLYQLLAYGNSRKVYDKYIKLMNDQFVAPYKLKEEQKKQEELKQKELAELARLKEKYEVNI